MSAGFGGAFAADALSHVGLRGASANTLIAGDGETARAAADLIEERAPEPAADRRSEREISSSRSVAGETGSPQASAFAGRTGF